MECLPEIMTEVHLPQVDPDIIPLRAKFPYISALVVLDHRVARRHLALKASTCFIHLLLSHRTMFGGVISDHFFHESSKRCTSAVVTDELHYFILLHTVFIHVEAHRERVRSSDTLTGLLVESTPPSRLSPSSVVPSSFLIPPPSSLPCLFLFVQIYFLCFIMSAGGGDHSSRRWSCSSGPFSGSGAIR